MNIRYRRLVAGVVVALFVASCGGGSNGASDDGTSAATHTQSSDAAEDDATGRGITAPGAEGREHDPSAGRPGDDDRTATSPDSDEIPGSATPSGSDSPRRRTVADDVIADGIAWATQAMRERHPGSLALADDPMFPALMTDACSLVLDAEAAAAAGDAVAAAAVADDVLALLPSGTNATNRNALTLALATFFSVGGCGFSPYVDTVGTELHSAA